MRHYSVFDMPEFRDKHGQIFVWDGTSQRYVPSEKTDMAVPDRDHASGGDNTIFDPASQAPDGDYFKAQSPETEGFMSRQGAILPGDEDIQQAAEQFMNVYQYQIQQGKADYALELFKAQCANLQAHGWDKTSIEKFIDIVSGMAKETPTLLKNQLFNPFEPDNYQEHQEQSMGLVQNASVSRQGAMWGEDTDGMFVDQVGSQMFQNMQSLTPESAATYMSMRFDQLSKQGWSSEDLGRLAQYVDSLQQAIKERTYPEQGAYNPFEPDTQPDAQEQSMGLVQNASVEKTAFDPTLLAEIGGSGVAGMALPALKQKIQELRARGQISEAEQLQQLLGENHRLDDYTQGVQEGRTEPVGYEEWKADPYLMYDADTGENKKGPGAYELYKQNLLKSYYYDPSLTGIRQDPNLSIGNPDLYRKKLNRQGAVEGHDIECQCPECENERMAEHRNPPPQVHHTAPFPDRDPKRNQMKTDDTYPSKISKADGLTHRGSMKRKRYSHVKEEYEHLASEPNLDACPDCEGPLTEHNQEKVCHDCGVRQPILYTQASQKNAGLWDDVKNVVTNPYVDAAGLGLAGGALMATGLGAPEGAALEGVAAGDVAGAAAAGGAADAGGGAAAAIPAYDGAQAVTPETAGGLMRGAMGAGKGAWNKLPVPAQWAIGNQGMNDASQIPGDIYNNATGAGSPYPGDNSAMQGVYGSFWFLADDDPGRGTPNRGLDHNPAEKEQQGFNEEHGDSPELLKGVDEVGESSEGDSHMDHSPTMGLDAMTMFEKVMPLVMHYFESEESGMNDPILKMLDEALEKEHPGYKGNDDGEVIEVDSGEDSSDDSAKPTEEEETGEDKGPSADEEQYQKQEKAAGKVAGTKWSFGPLTQPAVAPPAMGNGMQQPMNTVNQQDGPCPFCGGPHSADVCPMKNQAPGGHMPGMQAPGQQQPGVGGAPLTFAAHRKLAFMLEAARRPRMCPFHSELVEYSLTLNDPEKAITALTSHQFSDASCRGSWKGDHKCSFKPQFVTREYWDQHETDLADRRQRELERSQPQPVTQEIPSLEPIKTERDYEPSMKAFPDMDTPSFDGVSPSFSDDAPSAVGGPVAAKWHVSERNPMEGETFDECDNCGCKDHDEHGMCKNCGKYMVPDSQMRAAKTAGDVVPMHPHHQVDPTPDHIKRDHEPHGGHELSDAEGNPIMEGQDYQIQSPDYSIPDHVTVTHVSPDGGKVAVEYHTDGMDYTDELTKEDIVNDGLIFQPDQASQHRMQDEMNDGSIDLEQNDDSAVGHGDPGQVTDLSRAASVLPGNLTERMWLYEGSGVEVDPQLMEKFAAKDYTPREQREFIDESGTARNLDRLDLEGTHYIEDDVVTSHFLWG